MTTERRIDTGITIDAPADAVWKALTDADELANWFPLHARVTPGVGGKVWMSWGEQASYESAISAWEEEKRLEIVYAEPQAATEHFPEVPFRVAVEYLLEGRGGTTTLRLVQSGFSSDSTWDDQYDGTVRGWDYQLRGLRHYLEHHAGTPRVMVRAVVPIGDMPFDDAWPRVLSSEGLVSEGRLDGLAAGDRYAITTPRGDRLEGELWLIDPPIVLGGTVENLNNAYLRIALDKACFTQPQTEASIWLSTYGLPTATTDELQGHFQSMLEACVGGRV